MAEVKLFCVIATLFCVNFSYADPDDASKRFARSVFDTCSTICAVKYPLGQDLTKNPRLACQRGCQMINHLLVMSSGWDTNTTREICQGECFRAISSPKDRYACNLGCASKGQLKRQVMPLEVSWAIFQTDDAEIDDVLMDPALRAQLSPDSDADNRLPEMHIKTLPVVRTWEELSGDMVEYEPIQSSHPTLPHFTDWLECINRKTAVIRVLLSGVVLLSVLCALWVCLTPREKPSPRRRNQSMHRGYGLPRLVDSPPCHWYEPPQLDQAPPSPPPKYSDIVQTA